MSSVLSRAKMNNERAFLGNTSPPNISSAVAVLPEVLPALVAKEEALNNNYPSEL